MYFYMYYRTNMLILKYTFFHFFLYFWKFKHTDHLEPRLLLCFVEISNTLFNQGALGAQTP